MNRIFLTLSLALLSFGCDKASTSETKALPFVCKGEDASAVYFDQSQAYLLSGQIHSKDVKSLLVFGDSLSDVGELGRKSKDLLVPRCKYWFNHFSNGPMWSEYVSGGAGWGLVSYAVGGSGTSKQHGGSLLGWLSYLNPFTIKDTFQDLVLTSLLDQVDRFEKEFRKGQVLISPEHTIVSVWAGANNYFLQGRDVQDQYGNVDEVKAQQLVDATIADLHQAITRLKALGFTRISLGDLPDLGRLAQLPPDPSHIFVLASFQTLHFMSVQHNAAVEALAESFRKDGLDLIVFHSNTINDKTNEDPEAYGFDSIMPCYKGNVFGTIPGDDKAFCEHPLRQKSWDYPHPNTRMHCLYASQYVADARAAGWIDEGEDFAQACVNMRTKDGKE